MSNKSVREWFASLKQKTGSWLAKTNDPDLQKSSNLDHGGLLEGSFFMLGLFALSSLILGIIAFSRPAFRVAQDDISYEHLGVFSYSAPAPHGVYDLNVINSGDPIFTKLTCSVDVNLQYTLVAGQPENIAGTYQLTAIISEQVSGWQRAVPLQEETSFTGTAFGTKASLDLCKIGSLTQSLEQGTDFHPGSYTLVITPKIQINGEVSGRALESSFDPGLAFRYDRVQFYLVRNDEQGDSLTATATGLLREERKEANTMLLFGTEIPIPTLRLIAFFGLLGSLSALVVLGLRLQNLSRVDQEKFFRIKYDSMMIDVQNAISITASNVIDVACIENLAKLAERFNVMILHERNDSEHTYFVQVEGTTYRFVMNANETEPAVPEKETTSPEGGV